MDPFLCLILWEVHWCVQTPVYTYESTYFKWTLSSHVLNASLVLLRRKPHLILFRHISLVLKQLNHHQLTGSLDSLILIHTNNNKIMLNDKYNTKEIKIFYSNNKYTANTISNNALMRCVFYLYQLNLSIIVYKSLHNNIRKFVITFAVSRGDFNGRWEKTNGIVFVEVIKRSVCLVIKIRLSGVA